MAVAKPSRVSSHPLKLGEYLDHLLPGAVGGAPPDWPPDLFGLVAAVLQKSGAYSFAVCNPWPPKPNWAESMQRIGQTWRQALNLGKGAPPQVHARWDKLVRKQALVLDEVLSDHRLCEVLLELSAVCDEACVGIGLPSEEVYVGNLHTNAYLESSSTLCLAIHPSRLRVLPKLHTPQSGLTIRSFSHHLALCLTGEITPQWNVIPAQTSEPQSLNLLLIPWPSLIRPSQFRQAENILANMPKKYGFFTYDTPRVPRDVALRARKIFRNAKRLLGRIDGVVFPEASMSSAQHHRLREAILKKGAFLVAGICDASSTDKRHGKNFVEFDIPISSRHYVPITQNKHHRWRLDKSQIVQYGIGGNLDPERFWWESISVEKRKLHFVARRELTMAVMICEDLARQDPVSELVRAVGPTLVIALLMDGPQLTSRWSARYATVLADDPGSSVLTLTSLGMTSLCRPVNVSVCSRAVALWKDARSGGAIEISLPDGAAGLVLNLTIQDVEEWTADGRSDGETTSYALLSGVHPVYEDQ
jgi:hypothetical protein